MGFLVADGKRICLPCTLFSLFSHTTILNILLVKYLSSHTLLKNLSVIPTPQIPIGFSQALPQPSVKMTLALLPTIKDQGKCCAHKPPCLSESSLFSLSRLLPSVGGVWLQEATMLSYRWRNYKKQFSNTLLLFCSSGAAFRSSIRVSHWLVVIPFLVLFFFTRSDVVLHPPQLWACCLYSVDLISPRISTWLAWFLGFDSLDGYRCQTWQIKNTECPAWFGFQIHNRHFYKFHAIFGAYLEPNSSLRIWNSHWTGHPIFGLETLLCHPKLSKGAVYTWSGDSWTTGWLV